MPHLGADVFVAAAQIITSLQSIVSRVIDPANSAVVSITQVHGGDTWNALPDSVVLRGTFRCYTASVQALIQAQIIQIVESIARMSGLIPSILFNPENPGYPVTSNSEQETAIAAEVAQDLVGIDQVELQPTPSMGSEDFAFMLQERPGCYIWLGNGPSEGGCLLHNPNYDFNDDILVVGACYWVKLVERNLC